MARNFRHGRLTRVIADGRNISGYLKEASMSASMDTPETTAFSDTIKQWVTGLPDYSASLSGMYDATNNGTDTGSDTVLFNRFGEETPLRIVLANEGLAAGRRARVFEGIVSSYNLQNTVADMVALNMDMKITGQMYVTQHLFNFETTTISTIAGPITADRQGIWGAGTPYGGTITAGMVYVAFYNNDTISHTITLSDSADGTTFAALTGGSITVAAGSFGVLVTPSQVIDRHVRATLTANTVTNPVRPYIGLVDTVLSPILAE